MKRLFIIGISFLFISGIGLGLYFNPDVAASIKKRIFGGEPDLPDFAKHKVNKEQFMTRRAENLAMYRGIRKDLVFYCSASTKLRKSENTPIWVYELSAIIR